MESQTDRFSGRLLRDEKIVWSGRPRQGLMFAARDALLIPFSLLWGGFTLFWETNVLRAPNVPVFMALFGASFVLIGLFLIFGRFLLDAWIRAGIFYALTERRILILRSRPSANFQAVNLDRLPDMMLQESADGRGTIRFGPGLSLSSGRNAGIWIPALDPVPQFIGVADVKKVFSSIQERTRLA